MVAGVVVIARAISINRFWWLEVIGASVDWRSSVLLVESSALFCGGVVGSVVGGVIGYVLWWAALFCVGRRYVRWLLGGRPVQ